MSASVSSSSRWPTPVLSDSGEKVTPASLQHSCLLREASNWYTPTSRDHFPPHTPEYVASKKALGHGMGNLNDQVAHHWQTPSVASATGGQANRGGDRQNELLLAGQARDVSSRLALTISSPGSNTLPRTRTLNPQFVEALMAWPTGWSAFAYSETELSRWKADMRSVISRLPLPTRAPERQPDLFS